MIDVIRCKITKRLIETGLDNDGVVYLSDRLNKDLGADSLDVIEFVMQIEEMFDIELPLDIEDHYQTVDDYALAIAREFPCSKP